MFRIQVTDEARAQLTSFRPHVVASLGRLLGDLADALAAGGSTDGRLTVGDCAVHVEVDRAAWLLKVVHVEQRELSGLSWAESAAVP